MGLFGLFASREEREARRIRDLSKRAQGRYGDANTRFRALEALRDIGSPEAISGLLGRFTVRSEPQISDTEEKNETFRMVTEELGEKAVGPILDFLERQDQVSWVLRCLEAILPEEQVVGHLVELLDKMSRQYVREPDKKVLFLHYLRERSDPRVPAAALPYLEDPSDEVRIAALELLVAQEQQGAAGAIAACLIGAESPRVRAAAAAALADLGVPLSEEKESVGQKLPEGYQLNKGGIVRRA